MLVGYPEPPTNAAVTVVAPSPRNGIFVVVDPKADISSEPFDVTVRKLELRIVVFAPVPIVSAAVHADVDSVNVADVVKLLIIVKVGYAL